MSNGVTVNLIVGDSDNSLLDVALLKKAGDSEAVGSQISEDLALEKILGIQNGGSDFWIARDGQNPVGYAIGVIEGESYRSDEIYVTPKYRAKGIDTLLEQAQIEFARNLGCAEISLFGPSGAEHIVRLALKE